MKCVICKHGVTKLGMMTATFERNGTTIVVQGVPAEICEICGESYLSSEVSHKLLQQVQDSARAGVQVDIRKYLAA
jgi:YgiT-type zinc finger domain-containing protein